MAEAPRILLEHHLKRLKLPTFLREYEKLARQCAAEGLDHVRFLARLVELELIDRERRLVERRIKQAGFPVVKQLESFDFKAIPALNKMLVLDLARGEYIARRENVILLGPSGVGKTHVALALGLAACQKGLGVRFATAPHLVHELIEARDEKRLLRLQAQLARVNLLIVDELAAIHLLQELASDAQTFKECEENFINAFATLDTPLARELLMGFVEPGIHDIALTRRPHREEMLVERLAVLARRSPVVAGRLLELCERDLPEINRDILSKVMARLGTPKAMVANLNLIDDARSPSVPQGVGDQLESAFVERQPYERHPNMFTLQARASNDLRGRLFRLAFEDGKRRKSAVRLLGQIEVWRLEHGRPTDEPRHPDLASGRSWPPMEV